MSSMSFMSRWIRALCMGAFAAVTASTVLPALSHAAAPAKLPAGAVALVNGQPLAQSAIDNAVSTVMKQTGVADSPELRAMLKQDLIAHELLRQQAVRAHYDQRPEIAQVPEAEKGDAEIRMWIKDTVRPETVTDAAIKARYDAAIKTIGRDEYKPQVIAVADEATANTVIAAAKSGKPFGDLAREYGVGATKANAGEMPWISFKLPLAEGNTHGVPMPLAQAITSLKSGETLAQPLKAGDGWLIVRLDAKRPMAMPKFDASKEDIRRTLQDEAMAQAISQRVSQLAQQATIVE